MVYSTNSEAIKRRIRYSDDPEFRKTIKERNSKWARLNRVRETSWAILHPKEFAIIQKKSQWKIRLEVLIHYSNGVLKCKHCETEDVRVLTIDHINNNGAEHRKELGSSGTQFYSWLRKNGYPEGYQVLCFNCNWIKRLEMD